uniref:Claudin domain containing 2 n=1 Tax=Loxodonta africana TaxID=9785 RepID=G3U801_LOXAF
MGVKRSLQSGGTVLSFLANILMVLSTVTNYWTRYPDGHSGLWKECNSGGCSTIPCQSEAPPAQASDQASDPPPPPDIQVSIQMPDSRLADRGSQPKTDWVWWPGLLLLIAMTGYTVKDVWKSDVFFSWSYFSGWLALPFSILAGFCFLLADMIVQSTDAISGFPVCL